MNETFYTVAVFTYPTEVIVPRITLETAGIECITKDEETITANPMLSNAVGGIKLQVREQDFQKAAAILKESGVEIFTDDGASPIMRLLDRTTSKLPIVGKFKLHHRILIAMIFIVFVFMILVFPFFHWVGQPNFEEAFYNERFDIESIYAYSNAGDHKDSEDLIVARPGLHIVGSRAPMHPYGVFLFKFGGSGSFEIIGFCEEIIHGNWDVRGDDLELTELDTLSEFFEGEFDLELDGSKLQIQNSTTTINCSSLGKVWND